MVFSGDKKQKSDDEDDLDDEDEDNYASLKKKMDAGVDLWKNHRSFFFSTEGLL